MTKIMMINVDLKLQGYLTMCTVTSDLLMFGI